MGLLCSCVFFCLYLLTLNVRIGVSVPVTMRKYLDPSTVILCLPSSEFRAQTNMFSSHSETKDKLGVTVFDNCEYVLHKLPVDSSEHSTHIVIHIQQIKLINIKTQCSLCDSENS